MEKGKTPCKNNKSIILMAGRKWEKGGFSFQVKKRAIKCIFLLPNQYHICKRIG